jgi:hypothetical protein
MQAALNELPLTLEALGCTSRDAEWGDMNVAYERLAAGLDTRPLFVGLPDDRCQCPHWGYLLRGRLRVLYADREETVRAGQAYHLPPGHNIVVEEAVELVEFSPGDAYARTLEAVGRNLAARGAA